MSSVWRESAEADQADHQDRLHKMNGLKLKNAVLYDGIILHYETATVLVDKKTGKSYYVTQDGLKE